MTRRMFSILGDSISTFEGCIPEENFVYYTGEQIAETGVDSADKTWWMQVIDGLGGALLSNASFSGSLVEGAGFPAATSDERIAQLAGPGGEAPDVILVFMGINDYGWGGALHQAMARGNAVPPCVDLAKIPEGPTGAAPADALDKFEQAYDVMLGKARAAYPQAEVWCMTLLPARERGLDHPAFCYSLRGIPLASYNAAISAAAERNGCKVADLYGLGFDYEASDGTHPTSLGMEQVAAMTLAAMSGEGGNARILDDPRLFPPAMRSRNTCDEAMCVGCAFARAAGNQWSCVCER